MFTEPVNISSSYQTFIISLVIVFFKDRRKQAPNHRTTTAHTPNNCLNLASSTTWYTAGNKVKFIEFCRTFQKSWFGSSNKNIKQQYKLVNTSGTREFIKKTNSNTTKDNSVLHWSHKGFVQQHFLDHKHIILLLLYLSIKI